VTMQLEEVEDHLENMLDLPEFLRDQVADGGDTTHRQLEKKFWSIAYPLYTHKVALATEAVWFEQVVKDLLPEQFRDYAQVVPSNAVSLGVNYPSVFHHIVHIDFGAGIEVLVSLGRDEDSILPPIYWAMRCWLQSDFEEMATEVLFGTDPNAFVKLEAPAINYYYTDVYDHRYSLGEAIFQSTSARVKYDRNMALLKDARARCAELALQTMLDGYDEGRLGDEYPF